MPLIILIATVSEGGKGGSEGREEEICIHEHDHTAGPANSQEAGEQHKQRGVWRHFLLYMSLHHYLCTQQKVFLLKSNKLMFVYSSFKYFDILHYQL